MKGIAASVVMGCAQAELHSTVLEDVVSLVQVSAKIEAVGFVYLFLNPFSSKFLKKDQYEWLENYKNTIKYATGGKINNRRYPQGTQKAFQDVLAKEKADGAIPEATIDCWWKHQSESLGPAFEALKRMEKRGKLTDFKTKFLAFLQENVPIIEQYAKFYNRCKQDDDESGWVPTAEHITNALFFPSKFVRKAVKDGVLDLTDEEIDDVIALREFKTMPVGERANNWIEESRIGYGDTYWYPNNGEYDCFVKPPAAQETDPCKHPFKPVNELYKKVLDAFHKSQDFLTNAAYHKPGWQPKPA